MPKDKISMRQLLALLFAALLSPAVRVLPARTGGIAGRSGWLTALAALPVLLALCWALFALLGRTEGGLQQAFERVLGRTAGRVLAGVYLVWGILLLCANGRLFGLRFLSTSYRNAPLPLFIAALMALALWLARGETAVLARAGQVFYLALALGLGAVLLLGAFRVEPKNVLPVWVEDVPGILEGTLPVLAVLGYGIYGAFLAGSVVRRADDRRRTMKWAAAFCLVLTALQWVCLGSFGPNLAGRMESPFFMMVKGVGIEGAFERVESILIALWVFADLTMLALLLTACCRLAADIFPSLGEAKRGAVPLAILGLAGALWLFPEMFSLAVWMERVAAPGNLILGFAVPAGVLLAAKLREKRPHES